MDINIFLPLGKKLTLSGGKKAFLYRTVKIEFLVGGIFEHGESAAFSLRTPRAKVDLL